MAKTAAQIITIMRHATGREDSADPQFSDTIMLGYVNDFYQLIMGQDARFVDQNSWYEFTMTIGDDTYPIDMDAATGIGFSVLRPPAYIKHTDTKVTLYLMDWYQNPGEFYSIQSQVSPLDNQRPTAVLYYNNELIFRNPPDVAYGVKIAAIKLSSTLTNTSATIDEDCWWRYIAYGAAIDLMSDYSEFDNVAQLKPMFDRYRSIVYARTMTQFSNQRTFPSF